MPGMIWDGLRRLRAAAVDLGQWDTPLPLARLHGAVTALERAIAEARPCRRRLISLDSWFGVAVTAAAVSSMIAVVLSLWGSVNAVTP